MTQIRGIVENEEHLTITVLHPQMPYGLYQRRSCPGNSVPKSRAGFSHWHILLQAVLLSAEPSSGSVTFGDSNLFP